MDKSPKKTNPWVLHVRSFALKNGITYGCALSDPRCKETYKTGASMSPSKSNGEMTARELAKKIKNIELTAQVRKEKILKKAPEKPPKKAPEKAQEKAPEKPLEKTPEKAPEKVSYRIQNKEIYNIIDDYMKTYNSINPRQVSERERVVSEIKKKVDEYEKKTNSVLKKRGYDPIKDAFSSDFLWFDKQEYDKKVDRLKKKLEKAQEK